MIISVSHCRHYKLRTPQNWQKCWVRERGSGLQTLWRAPLVCDGKQRTNDEAPAAMLPQLPNATSRHVQSVSYSIETRTVCYLFRRLQRDCLFHIYNPNFMKKSGCWVLRFSPHLSLKIDTCISKDVTVTAHILPCILCMDIKQYIH